MDGPVHPITRTTFFGAQKANPLKREFATDERIEVKPFDEDIPAGGRGVAGLFGNAKIVPHLNEVFPFKECDLPFEIRFVIKIPIPGDPPARDAFDLVHFHNRVLPGGTAVMTPVIVIGRNIEMADGRCHGGKGSQQIIPPPASGLQPEILPMATTLDRTYVSNRLLTCKE